LQATMHINDAVSMAVADRAMPSGLDVVFQKHRELVFRAAYRVTGNASDAEDVLQTVFLRLVRLEEMPGVVNLPGYLHRSAVNASLDILRTRKDSTTVSLDEGPRQTEPFARESTSRSLELRDWLRQALARLNPRWAEMFVLRFVEDYSNREIASMMKTSPAVVAVVLHRTRALLKKEFVASTRGPQ
jgi:RNA polymerase sigma-70 factor (ECF subfamily)